MWPRTGVGALRHPLVHEACNDCGIDVEAGEHLHGDVAPGRAVEQAEEEVLGVDRRVTAVASGGLRGDDGSPGAGSEAAEPTLGQTCHQPAEQAAVALLGRLSGDAEGVADLGPRAALGPRVLHEVVEQLVAERVDLVLQRGRRSDTDQRISVASLFDRGDQVVQVHRLST